MPHVLRTLTGEGSHSILLAIDNKITV